MTLWGVIGVVVVVVVSIGIGVVDKLTGKHSAWISMDQISK